MVPAIAARFHVLSCSCVSEEVSSVDLIFFISELIWSMRLHVREPSSDVHVNAAMRFTLASSKGNCKLLHGTRNDEGQL